MNNANEMLVLAEMMGIYKSGIRYGAVTYYPNKSQDKEKIFNPSTYELLMWLLTKGEFLIFRDDCIEFLDNAEFKFCSRALYMTDNILNIAVQVAQHLKGEVEDE